MPSRDGELDRLASRTRHVLIDFDGPVCSIFSGIPSHAVADELRSQLRKAGFEIPGRAGELPDPLEIFRAVADQGPAEAMTAQYMLTGLEVRAAVTARPAPGADDLIRTAIRTRRTVTVVTNNSSPAVATYLETRHLLAEIRRIVGRDDPDPALMKPSPYRVRIAIDQLDADPGDCMLIGDTETDVVAGMLAGVPVVGYANKPGKAETLTRAGARAVVADLAEITAALGGTTPGDRSP